MKLETGTFKTFDNQELFYRQWEHEEVKSNGKILLLLHRGHEYSERLTKIAENKKFEGYKIYSYDNRGHGESKVSATYEFMDLVRDLNSFVSFVCEKENKKEEEIFIIANSVSGVVCSTWVHDYAPKIKGMALVAPAFKIKLYFPFAKEILKIATHLKPELNIKSYVKGKFLTHNQVEQHLYDNDLKITPNIPAKQLTSLLDTAQRIVKDSDLITIPTLVLSATNDYVVDTKIQGDFYSNLSSDKKKFVQLDGFYHGVLYEVENQIAIDEISKFMDETFKLPNIQLVSSEFHEDPFIKKLINITEKEKDMISYGSLPLLESLNYSIQKLSMNTIGFISDGMKIGMKYGFDSGVTLDYVYKNKPSGIGYLGVKVDENYLNSIGWKGIRQRKVNLIETIKEKIRILEKRGEKVKILDIAGGPARYLIEIAHEYKDVQIEVRDYQEQNINEGRQLAEDKNLTNIKYKQSDAFSPESYNKKDGEYNIVVISGVFELFSDNDLIEKAITGVSSIMSKDSFLVYTGQPWHPQLSQIANVLGNHQNTKWVMRRRSQYELDYIFNSKGFVKENMKIDDWGIFTVSSSSFIGK